MLETAGPMGKFELKWVRHPQKAQSKISELQLMYNQQRQASEVQRRQDELLNWFATYDRIRSDEFSSGSGGASVAP